MRGNGISLTTGTVIAALVLGFVPTCNADIVGDTAIFAVSNTGGLGIVPPMGAVIANPAGSYEIGTPGGVGVQYLIDVHNYVVGAGVDTFDVEYRIEDFAGLIPLLPGGGPALTWSIGDLDWLAAGGGIVPGAITGVAPLLAGGLTPSALPVTAGAGLAPKSITFDSAAFAATGPGVYSAEYRFSVTHVPEPSALTLLGICGILGFARRRTKRHS